MDGCTKTVKVSSRIKLQFHILLLCHSLYPNDVYYMYAKVNSLLLLTHVIKLLWFYMVNWNT